MADSPSHQQFLRRLEEARPSALAALAEGRYGYARRLLQRADELIGGSLRRGYGKEDAVQSLFRVLVRDFQAGKKRHFQHSWALWRFLERVLRNRIQGRGGCQQADSLPSDCEPVAPSSGREARIQEDEELVKVVLSYLPSREQEICRLVGQGLKYRQIGRQLGCAVRTVHRALGHFAIVRRQLLGENDGGR